MNRAEMNEARAKQLRRNVLNLMGAIEDKKQLCFHEINAELDKKIESAMDSFDLKTWQKLNHEIEAFEQVIFN